MHLMLFIVENLLSLLLAEEYKLVPVEGRVPSREKTRTNLFLVPIKIPYLKATGKSVLRAETITNSLMFELFAPGRNTSVSFSFYLHFVTSHQTSLSRLAGG